jgi:hypothetical protein
MMRFPSKAAFPPPPPANDPFGLVQWPVDSLRRVPVCLSRRIVWSWRMVLLDWLMPLGLLALALWAAGFRG